MTDIEKRAWAKYPEVIKHHNLATIDINEEKRKMYIEIATEQKAVDEVRYQKLRELALDMYTRAQSLSTDAGPLREAMEAFHHFIVYEEK